MSAPAVTSALAVAVIRLASTMCSPVKIIGGSSADQTSGKVIKPPRKSRSAETIGPRYGMKFVTPAINARASGDGSPITLRARAKSSCFCNLSVVGPLAVGCLVADIPAIVGSVDIVMGEVDR